MYLGIIDVKPLKDYFLLLKFENNEEKIFDVKPYLEIGKFRELKDKNLLAKLHRPPPLTNTLAPR